MTGMNSVTAEGTAASVRTDRYSRDARRKKRIKNIKTGGNLMMYVGSAALMRPLIAKAHENQNGIVGICATCAGAVLTFGIGNAASKVLEKTIDKVVDFWDDVKPSSPAIRKKQDDEENPQEDEDDG